MGPLARTFAVSLQELSSHLQCADLGDADGCICARKRNGLRSRPGDDRGQEPGQDQAQLWGGVHPTTAFRWRHRFLRAPAVNKPRSLSGIVEADETLVLGSLQGPMVRSAARLRANGRRQGQASGPLSGQYSCSRRPRPEARDLRRGPASGRRGFHRKSACRRGHTGQPSDRRRRPGTSPPSPARAGILFHAVLAPGKPAPQAPYLHINTVNAYHGRCPNSGSTASQRRRHQKPAKLSPDGAALSKPGATNSNHPTGSKARSETDHTYS